MATSVHSAHSEKFVHLPDEGNLSRAGSVYMSKSLGSHPTEAGDLVLDLNEGVPQVTVKALLSGVLCGIVCSFLALYYGLKVGITPSLNILGGVMGFAVTKALMSTGFFGTVFTPQENAVIQTVSVAVYSVACPSFGLTSGFLGLSSQAYDIVGDMNGNRIEDTLDLAWWRSVVWCLSLFSFGFFLAYALRNHYVITKRLLYPSGTATAYVISSLHSSAGAAAKGLAVISKFFSIAFIINMITWCFSGLGSFPLFGMAAAKYGWMIDFDLGTFGIGLLLSMQVNASMLFGALVTYGCINPWIMNHKEGDWDGAWFSQAHAPSAYLGLKAYPLFAGLAVMIVQGAWGICSIVFTVIHENRKEKKRIAEGRATVLADELTERRDTHYKLNPLPMWMILSGYLGTGSICILVMHFVFDTHWYQTLVAIVIIPLLAFSNIEGMGRTDWDVASSYGKLMMFPIGAWNKGGSIIPCISVCHTTVSGCSNAALLMQDFKTGYLLGAAPTTMFYCQIFGTLVGCLVCPSLLMMLRAVWTIPSGDPSAFIPGIYAPVFRTLAVVATGSGFSALPKYCLAFALFFVCFALALNIIMVCVEKWAPRYAQYIPEPSALSIGMLVGCVAPLEFFIGGLVAYFWSRWEPAQCEEERNYIASGCIAGSGIAVVLQCLMSICGVKSGIDVTYASPQNIDYLHAGGWVAAAVGLCICVAVAYLGAKFWFSDAPAYEAIEDDHRPGNSSISITSSSVGV